MKYLALCIPLLLLSRCANTEGLASVPISGYLPSDVDVAALNEVIDYENLNKYGEEIKSITPIEKRRSELKLRVITGDSENVFVLNLVDGGWQISEVI